MVLQAQNKPGELLALNGISLDYGQFRALNNIHFTLARSEVHALVGEHGAGKSSLGMILSGVQKPLFGHIRFDGKDYPALTPKMSTNIGIEMVHQHTLSLNKYFTVADNFALDSTPLYKFWQKKRIFHGVQLFLSQYGIDIDPSIPVKKLNLSDQLFIDILKHIYPRPRLLILDEALEKLTSADFTKIVTILMALKREGTSILLITHRIDDIYDLADRVSVIKNGVILLTDEVQNIDKINLIKMAYTQISAEQDIDNLNSEFYQFLKYNEAILQNLPVNLIITDNENRIKLINAHCKYYFNFEKIFYLNAPLHQLVSSPNDEVLDLFNRAFSSHEEKTFYQVPLTVNTVNITSNIKIFPIYDGTFLIGNIIIIEDMTEYDHLQKQVETVGKVQNSGILENLDISNPL